MFGKCIKNYIFTLRYTFAVMGILFLGILIGGTILVSGSKNALTDMTEQIKDITANKDVTSEDVITDSCVSFLSEFESDSISDRGSIDDDGDMLVSGGEIQGGIVDAITKTVSIKFENFVDYVDKIGIVISGTIETILALMVVYVIVQMLAMVAGKSFVLMVERAEIEHRNAFHMIMARTLHNIGVIVLLFVAVFLLFEVPMVGAVFALFCPLLYCVVTLLTAILGQGKKHRAPFKNVFTIGNILTLFSSNIVILILFVAIGVGVLYISNLVVAFYIELSLWIVTSAAVALNADYIVYTQAKREIE